MPARYSAVGVDPPAAGHHQDVDRCSRPGRAEAATALRPPFDGVLAAAFVADVSDVGADRLARSKKRFRNWRYRCCVS
jgi:hypothetical protein